MPQEKVFKEIIIRGTLSVVFIFVFNWFLAGRLDYWQGWLFALVMAAITLVNFILFRNKQDLAKERMSPGKGMKGWDKIILPGLAIFIFIAWIVGVLDSGRYFWTDTFPAWTYVASYLLFLFSIFLFTWPMLVNRWFSGVVRIQKDRNQQVCDQGPYKYVRHPGYVGGILLSLSVGLLFGSWWSLIPGGVGALFIILRTYLEDKTLQKELPGYKEYTKKVKYRLVPGLW